jgi:hypothetical protein
LGKVDWWALAILEEVHGHPLPYAYVCLILLLNICLRMDSSDDVGAAVDASGLADGVRWKKRPLISRKAEGRGRGDGSDAEAPGSQEGHYGAYGSKCDNFSE